MTYSSCLIEANGALILDASVVINLLATGCSERVVGALSLPIIIADEVKQEVVAGEAAGHRLPTPLVQLLDSGTIAVVQMDHNALTLFRELVAGPVSQTLGDGEAATIALAASIKGSAVIDEKKATKVAADRHAEVRVATTVDILSHPNVVAELGQTALSDAVKLALRVARMQVRAHQFEWIERTIGPEGVPECPSLRRLARMPRATRPEPPRQKQGS